MLGPDSAKKAVSSKIWLNIIKDAYILSLKTCNIGIKGSSDIVSKQKGCSACQFLCHLSVV